MRNENLRNKLNNVSQDFDSNKIWESIELPKKKKKRRGLIWFLFGAGVFGIVVTMIFYIGNSDTQGAIALETKSVNQPADLEVNGVLNEKDSGMSKPVIGNGETLASQDQMPEKANEIITSISLLNKNIDFQYDNNENKRSEHVSEQLNAMSTDQSEIKWAESKQNQIPFDQMEFSKNDSAIVIEKGMSYQKNENLGRSASTILESKLKYHALPLPRFVFGSIDRSDQLANKEIRFSITNKKEQKTQIFALSLNTLYGLSNHDFGNTSNSESRQSNEKALETITIDFMGQALLSNFQLYSGLSFIRHNTLFSNSITDYSIGSSLDGRPLRKDVTTKYSLYNSYEYLDFIVGMGYRLIIADKWSITPSLQAGYSLHFKSKGQIFNQNDELLNLSQFEENNNYSKWQGQANIKITRQLNLDWEVGFIAYMNSQKRLVDSIDFLHSASSKGIGVSISRFIR